MQNINRPQFLTAICIITFIVSGYSIFSAITGYFNADNAEETRNQLMEMLDKVFEDIEEDPSSAAAYDMLEGMKKRLIAAYTTSNLRANALASLLGHLSTLIGALFMWRLRKLGFHFYLGGWLVLIASPLLIYGMGLFGYVSAGIFAFFGIIFIGLYAVNRKHLTE